MESVQERLVAVIERWNLLRHPFYEAWSNGELPASQLQRYSAEYAPFIARVAQLWDACGEPLIAAEERDHYGLWKDFARSLHCESFPSATSSTGELLRGVDQSLRSLPGALGTLYAFEAQQPLTSRSKLAGLEGHYRHLGAELTYFKIHQDDFSEPELLLSKITALDSAGAEECIESCDATCRRLWETLSKIHLM